LESTKGDLQPESVEMEERDVVSGAESQIQRLDPMQLAIWISAAPDPQRSALALFYLDEFDYREILDIAELKLGELSGFLSKGRRQLQAWLDSKFPQSDKV
jgi:DNA-directed RNA polymerase specialized sigma24 family protein